jgi:hypothetical protein
MRPRHETKNENETETNCMKEEGEVGRMEEEREEGQWEEEGGKSRKEGREMEGRRRDSKLTLVKIEDPTKWSLSSLNSSLDLLTPTSCGSLLSRPGRKRREEERVGRGRRRKEEGGGGGGRESKDYLGQDRGANKVFLVLAKLFPRLAYPHVLCRQGGGLLSRPGARLSPSPSSPSSSPSQLSPSPSPSSPRGGSMGGGCRGRRGCGRRSEEYSGGP